MLRGYRSLGFAALVALAFVSFGLGAYTIYLGKPEGQERHQSYQGGDQNQRGALASVTNIASASMHDSPCKKPQTETQRDLCQQWRSANAAEKSAQWTVFGVLASIVGITLLLWQIMLTREAVKDTGDATKAMREANEIARQIGEAQVRCYISGVESKIVFRNKGNITVTCCVKNTGQSPAKRLSWSPELTILMEGGSPVRNIKPFSRDAFHEIDIAAGAVEDLDFVKFEDHISKFDLESASNDRPLYVRIDANIAAYDVFGNYLPIGGIFHGLIRENPYSTGWIVVPPAADIKWSEDS